MSLLKNLTFRAKAIFTVFMIVSLVIAMYIAAYRPKMSEMMKTQSMLRTIVAEIDEQMQIEGTFIAPTADDAREWSKVERELARRIPENMDLPTALESISALARDIGIEDLSMASSPQGEEKTDAERIIQVGDKQFYLPSEDDDSQGTNPLGGTALEQTTIEIALHCEYVALAEFLESLCRLPRFIVVQRVEISRELPKASVNMSVMIFSLSEREQVGQIASSGQGIETW